MCPGPDDKPSLLAHYLTVQLLRHVWSLTTVKDFHNIMAVPAWQARMQHVSFDAAEIHDAQVMQIGTNRHSGTLQICVQ